jgi:hypothetical protein
VSNLDEALERFHLSDLEYAGGLASHGPMAAEALESLGHQALIPALLDLYAPRLPPASPGKILAPDELKAARGAIERRADWVATFEARLESGDWRALLREAASGLWPGLFAAAGHGLLRTAHAARSLEREDSPLRRRELARGLAYWEARYQRLPGDPGKRNPPAHSSSSRLHLAGYFETLPLVREPGAREGLFFEAIRRLDSFAPFVESIEQAPVPGRGESVGAWLGELARIAASLYLAHPESRIAYVHAVTIPVALAGLIPLVGEEVAALHSLFGERRGRDERGFREALGAEVIRTAESWDEIRYRAACSIQEHAIKLVEACWRQHRIVPDPVFRLAAADAALELEGRRGAGGC